MRVYACVCVCMRVWIYTYVYLYTFMHVGMHTYVTGKDAGDAFRSVGP